MNLRKSSYITSFTLKRKQWILIAVLSIVLFNTSCEEDSEPIPSVPDEVLEYPSLRIVNQNTDHRAITSVSLVGYEFKNLSIAIGSSQTFTLDKGMPGGYSNINVSVSHKYSAWLGTESLKVDFNHGDTTAISLKGCLSFEGCKGFHLDTTHH